MRKIFILWISVKRERERTLLEVGSRAIVLLCLNGIARSVDTGQSESTMELQKSNGCSIAEQ